jgi:hypothetical protein
MSLELEGKKVALTEGADATVPGSFGEMFLEEIVQLNFASRRLLADLQANPDQNDVPATSPALIKVADANVPGSFGEIFQEELVRLNLEERTAPRGLLGLPALNSVTAEDFTFSFVDEMIQLNRAGRTGQDVAPADSFSRLMSSGEGSLQTLIDSSVNMKNAITTYATVIDRVIEQHGGLKNFQPSALYKSPKDLVAVITGDEPLAGIFKAQAIAKGVYPAQPLPEAVIARIKERDEPSFGL